MSRVKYISCLKEMYSEEHNNGLIYAPYVPFYVVPHIGVDGLRNYQFSGSDWRIRMLGERSVGRTFPILVKEVQAALKKGRAEHLTILKEAQEGYKSRVIQELEKALKEAREGIRYRTALSLPMPQSYLKEYDNAIDLLASIVRAGMKKIDLTADEYERFVRNKWEWMNQFAAVANNYSATSRISYSPSQGLDPLGDLADE